VAIRSTFSARDSHFTKASALSTSWYFSALLSLALSLEQKRSPSLLRR